MRKAASTFTFLFILTALVSAGESAKSLYQKGVKAEARQDYEAAYDYYKAAYDQKPQELRYRLPYERMRFEAAAVKIKRAQKLREQGKLQEAIVLFQQAAAIDPSNDLALQEIRRTQQMLQKDSGGGKGPSSKREDDDPLRKRLESAGSPIELAPISNIPLTNLEFSSEDTKVIYETIGKLAAINVLFDPDYTSRRLPMKLQKVSLMEALDIVALESRTFWRPVTPNTIFVAQDSQAKRRELEQNVVKTFYLGNVSAATDLQDMVNALRTVLELQRIQQVPSQSAIIIKGTPDQLALATKMIDDIDKSKPEVVIDVVVAQVRKDKGRTLGIVPPQNATVSLQAPTTTTSGTGSTTTSLNFNDIQHLNSTSYALTIDSVKAQALFNDDDTKILQSPRIRATDNEKATLKIADKIPIATGSFGSPLGVGTAVGAVGVNTQFSYTDVGVILEITPRVHPDGQVSLKLSMEISNVSSQSTIGGITQPIISTRKAEQTIRLNDGEVSLLGGILEQQEARTKSGTPFLGQIPLLRYLFSSEKVDHINNEIVFLLVPHVVRGQELSELNRRAFDVGTGSSIDLRIAGKQPAAQVESAPATTVAAPSQPVPAPRATTAERPIVAPPVAQPTPQRVTPPAGQNSPTGSVPAEATPATPSSTGGQVSLKLAPENVAPQQGSTFALNIVLAHGQDIAAVPIQISYDARVVQFVSVSNGDYLAKDGQQVALVYRDDSAAGKLQVTAQRPPGSAGVSGDGTVFSLLFMAKAKGTGAVSISMPGARNSQNQLVEVLGSQAAVNVN